MAETKIERERLKEIHQSDLTEGRVNQDFLDWLKSKGMTYLLVVMVLICGYLGWIRWRESRVGHQTEAWVELSQAALPRAFEDVADKYPEVGSVADLARLRAAQRLLGAVQTNTAVGADLPSTDPTAVPPAPLPLSAEDRRDHRFGRQIRRQDLAGGDGFERPGHGGGESRQGRGRGSIL